MLFNSIDFAVFLPVVFCVYWSTYSKHLTARNLIILGSSYLFYGWWDWRFLLLILLSTLADFTVGIALHSQTSLARRKALLWVSILTNLGLLGVFKYCNFFIDAFGTAFSLFGRSLGVGSLNIILPVGISFYTFQTLSYTIDVYRGKIEPTRNFVAFAAFVSFFPQLVAGPIERARNLLPQFFSSRTFETGKAVDGLRQILWGLFKKVVIADNCAEYVNLVFSTSSDHSGSTLALGAVLFAFQIYGDFSGYSDIAIGSARLLGFDLMRNFAYPYFARDIAEFWRRWHISLSTWFRDYVYIPLGGSRCKRSLQVRNVFVVFLVSGLWHGANWTFVVWGALHALFFLPLLLTNANRTHIEIVSKGEWLPGAREALSMVVTFALTTLAWIFFRAESIGHAVHYVAGIFSASIIDAPFLPALSTLVLIVLFLLIEWNGREHAYAIEHLAMRWPRPLRWTIYYAASLSILLFARPDQEFIYFQF